MLNLYTYDIKKKCYFYDGARISGDQITKHSGRMGSIEEVKTYTIDKSLSEEENLIATLQSAIRSGYREIDVDHHFAVLVEYAIADLGKRSDVEKKYRLEEHLDEVLSSAGLGFCDGGSISPGAMAARCFVVDIDVATAIIEANLEGTEFGDYTCIRVENV